MSGVPIAGGVVDEERPCSVAGKDFRDRGRLVWVEVAGYPDSYGVGADLVNAHQGKSLLVVSVAVVDEAWR